MAHLSKLQLASTTELRSKAVAVLDIAMSATNDISIHKSLPRTVHNQKACNHYGCTIKEALDGGSFNERLQEDIPEAELVLQWFIGALHALVLKTMLTIKQVQYSRTMQKAL